MSKRPHEIRVGVGGWTYEPWRDNFYPAGLTQARELEYASRQLTAIEINATYYRLQSATSFAKWRDATPEGFKFAVKASRYCTNRRVLGEAGEAIDKFFASGMSELGSRLGPVVWQFATTKQFEPVDFTAFLRLLPRTLGTLSLRHAIEVRHASFACAEYLALAREHDVATVFADSYDYPSFADLTSDFVYARLMKARPDLDSGYPLDEISAWASAASTWAAGDEPKGLPAVEVRRVSTGAPRDVFLFFISGAKERAPAAAVATIGALRAKAPQQSGSAATTAAPAPE